MILFDVGANWGSDSLDKTRDDPTVKCYAFEPTPELINNLTNKSRSYSDRYTIVPIALSDFDGTAMFNVTAHADWGCSSLLTFSDGLKDTWPGRTDFYSERQIEVQVRRLDGWLPEHPEITQIDFFHCDTQGCDLAVLRGMGDFISMIKDGVIEVPQSPEVRLYKGQHTKEEALDFLNDKGFEVYKTASQQNEDNIYFRPK
jgi:FkbM family methyltransferase